MPDPLAHELDDGTGEVVDLAPMRRAPEIGEAEDAALARPGGHLLAAREIAAAGAGEFITIRGARGALKLSFSHVPVFKALWRVWAGKRARGAADPGATVAEVAAEMQVATDAIKHILPSLLRNEVITSKVSYLGFGGARAAYYPSELGVLAIATADTFGLGVSIQVGRTETAWRSRHRGEPSNLFHHAALLRGGAEPIHLDQEFA